MLIDLEEPKGKCGSGCQYSRTIKFIYGESVHCFLTGKSVQHEYGLGDELIVNCPFTLEGRIKGSGI